jgi:hypothetical protein
MTASECSKSFKGEDICRHSHAKVGADKIRTLIIVEKRNFISSIN